MQLARRGLLTAEDVGMQRRSGSTWRHYGHDAGGAFWWRGGRIIKERTAGAQRCAL